MNARRLTVSRHYPESGASRSRCLPPTPMPFLRLQGRWLDQAGFAIGANVRVVNPYQHPTSLPLMLASTDGLRRLLSADSTVDMLDLIERYGDLVDECSSAWGRFLADENADLPRDTLLAIDRKLTALMEK